MRSFAGPSYLTVRSMFPAICNWIQVHMAGNMYKTGVQYCTPYLGPSYLTVRSSVYIIFIWDPCIFNLYNLCQNGSNYIWPETCIKQVYKWQVILKEFVTMKVCARKKICRTWQIGCTSICPMGRIFWRIRRLEMNNIDYYKARYKLTICLLTRGPSKALLDLGKAYWAANTITTESNVLILINSLRKIFWKFMKNFVVAFSLDFKKLALDWNFIRFPKIPENFWSFSAKIHKARESLF